MISLEYQGIHYHSQLNELFMTYSRSFLDHFYHLPRYRLYCSPASLNQIQYLQGTPLVHLHRYPPTLAHSCQHHLVIEIQSFGFLDLTVAVDTPI